MTEDGKCYCKRADVSDSGLGPFCLSCGRPADGCTNSPVSSAGNASDGYDDGGFDWFEEVRPNETALHTIQNYEQDDSGIENEDAVFIHQPLRFQSEIRLIRLFPSKEYGNQISCRIIHASLTDCDAAYEALSYTWGSADNVETININAGQTLSVTQNCADAMRDLRDAEDQRILWIDAICIDQHNIQERNHQVALMGGIYSMAKRVIIYTGKEYSPVQKYLEALKSGDSEYVRNNLSPTWFQSLVTAFLSRPWFNRVWVLQEVAMARDALILFPRGETLRWNYLSIASLNTLGVAAVDTSGKVPPVLQLSQTEEKPLKDIISLMNMAGSCQSSDPRDKIYALLGLLKDADDLGLRVDYAKCTEDLYQEIAILVIKTYNHLDVLSYCGPNWLYRVTEKEDNSSKRNPSWVPHLNFLPLSASLARWRKKADASYTASPMVSFESCGTNIPGSLSLHVHVLPLDRVDIVEREPGQPLPVGASFWNGVAFEIAEELQEPTIIAEARTIRAALLSGSYEKAFQRKPNNEFYDPHLYLLDDDSDDWWLSQDLTSLSLQSYGYRAGSVKNFSHGRFFVPTQRSFAICSRNISQKDIICVIRGASVPFVLRRTSPGSFWLVGECYLHGFKASSFAEDYNQLLGAYLSCFEKPRAWEIPEFVNMGTIDEEGNLPWKEVCLI